MQRCPRIEFPPQPGQSGGSGESDCEKDATPLHDAISVLNVCLLPGACNGLLRSATLLPYDKEELMRVNAVRSFLGAALILAAFSGWASEPIGQIKGVVTKLDAQNRVVGVKEEATGKLWELTLGASDALSELKIGQKVVVDLKAKTLTLAKNKFAIAKATSVQLKKDMKLITALGVGEFQVTGVGPDWVAFKNVRTQKTARYRRNAGNFETGMRIRVTAEDFSNSGGTGADLNCGTCRKDCTTVSTGSDPGPGDDTVSCVCISPDGRACG
jgi:hypothetical protein